MERGERLLAASVLAALYLRGSPFPRVANRRRWVLVSDTLLSSSPCWDRVGAALRSRGLYDEAEALSVPGRLEWGHAQVETGRALSAASVSYPARWIEVLGSSAPPALWMSGVAPSGPSIAVVGSRVLEPNDAAFARRLGSWVIEAGHCLVSGGAPGSDTAAALGALSSGGEGRVVVVLPHGLDTWPTLPGVTYLSATEPGAPFSSGGAMERNALIYASSRLAFVVRSAFKQGGTWLGATDALRRGLCQIGVRERKDDAACDALCKLGAFSVRTKADVMAAIARQAQGDTSSRRLFL